MNETIRFKELKDNQHTIIQIVDEYSVIIDAGKEDGYKVGDEFEIYVEGYDILDPIDPSVVLGKIDDIKGIVVIYTIFDTVSICRSNQFSPSFMQTSSMLSQTLSTGSRLKLNVNPEHMKPIFNKKDKEIKVGDKVRFSRQSK